MPCGLPVMCLRGKGGGGGIGEREGGGRREAAHARPTRGRGRREGGVSGAGREGGARDRRRGRAEGVWRPHRLDSTHHGFAKPNPGSCSDPGTCSRCMATIQTLHHTPRFRKTQPWYYVVLGPSGAKCPHVGTVIGGGIALFATEGVWCRRCMMSLLGPKVIALFATEGVWCRRCMMSLLRPKVYGDHTDSTPYTTVSQNPTLVLRSTWSVWRQVPACGDCDWGWDCTFRHRRCMV